MFYDLVNGNNERLTMEWRNFKEAEKGAYEWAHDHMEEGEYFDTNIIEYEYNDDGESINEKKHPIRLGWTWDR